MIAPRPAESQLAGAAPEMRHAVVGQNKKGRFSPKLPFPLSPRFTERLHDRPGNFVPSYGERPHRFQFQLNQEPHILTVQDLAPALPFQPGELFPSRLSHIPAANRKEN